MKKKLRFRSWFLFAMVAIFVMPTAASAQKEMHWQINPGGFPSDVAVFVDVETNGAFVNNLKGTDFSVSIDEFAGDQGGLLLNKDQVVAGQAGADVLVIVDKSSSYTGAFSMAKRVIKHVISTMDPNRDRVAIATAPNTAGFQESNLDVPFSNDPAVLNQGVDALSTLPSNNRTGARLCNALAEGLRFFPESPANKYRAVVLITGGADKGEGKGDCVKESFSAGGVPFFPVLFKLDRKYDHFKNAHEIENKTHELAQRTGGRSIFRQSENHYKNFITLMWNRIRSQYYLRVMFPCYRPAPATEHASVLKVQGKDASPLQFKATSAPPPTPQITAIYPQQAALKDVEDGNVTLTVDGTGFCGEPGTVKVLVNNVETAPKKHSPFRVESTLAAAHDTGKVKVVNRFGQHGESPMQFQVVKTAKISQTRSTLTIMAIALVLFAAFSVLLVTLRSRRAKPGAASKASQPAAKSATPSPEKANAKTMAMSGITKAWAELEDGTRIELKPGDNIIGREVTCRIQLAIPGVSREHSRIQLDVENGLAWVEDLGSTNGTFYGKGHVKKDDAEQLDKKQLLSSGDAIWIGGTRILMHFDGGVEGEG